MLNKEYSWIPVRILGKKKCFERFELCCLMQEKIEGFNEYVESLGTEMLLYIVDDTTLGYFNQMEEFLDKQGTALNQKIENVTKDSKEYTWRRETFGNEEIVISRENYLSFLREELVDYQKLSNTLEDMYTDYRHMEEMGENRELLLLMNRLENAGIDYLNNVLGPEYKLPIMKELSTEEKIEWLKNIFAALEKSLIDTGTIPF